MVRYRSGGFATREQTNSQATRAATVLQGKPDSDSILSGGPTLPPDTEAFPEEDPTGTCGPGVYREATQTLEREAALLPRPLVQASPADARTLGQSFAEKGRDGKEEGCGFEIVAVRAPTPDDFARCSRRLT